MSKKIKQKNFSGKIVCENGISFRSDIAFKLDKQPAASYYPLFQLLITVLSAASAVFMAISFLSEELYTISAGSILITVLLTSLSVLLFSQPNGFFKGLGAVYLILNTLFILIKLKETVNGMIYVIYTYTKKAGLSEPMFTNMVTASSKRDADMFFIAFAFLITLGTSLACIYRTNFPLLFLCTFPVFELGTFWGWEPASWTAVAMLICWITILSLNIINHTTKNKNSRNTFAIYKRKKIFYMTSENLKKQFFSYIASFAMIMTVAVFIIGALAAGMLDSYRPEKINEMRKEISNGFQNFTMELSDRVNINSDTFPGRGKMIGGINGGKLGLYDEITFKGTTALNIETETLDKPLYLRGYAAGSYGGNAWDPIKIDDSYQDEFKENGVTAADYGYLAASGDTVGSSVSVKAVNANKDVIYAPYQTNYSQCGNVKKQQYDGMLTPKKANERYSLDYLLPAGDDWEDVINSASENSLNDNYIYDSYDEYVSGSADYLSTPGRITPLLDEILAGAENVGSVNGAADYIRNYFEENGFYYTLNPGITPANEDFVEYFLTEQKKGYCTYYASAGVMLMRRLGFPARYVEGYVVEPSQCDPNSNSIRVSDRSAHAWCEVYIRNQGWFPVEFTPGYENDNPNLIPSERAAERDDSSVSSAADKQSSSVSSSAVKTPAATDTSSKESKVSSASEAYDSKKDSETADTSDTSDVSGDAATGTSGEGSQAAGRTGKKPINTTAVLYCAFGILFALIAVLAIVVRRKTALDRIGRSIGSQNSSEAVIACYKQCLRYLALFGMTCDENVTDTQQSMKIADLLEQLEPSLKSPFLELADTAVTANMSEGKIADEDAQRARAILDQICGTLYPKMSFLKRQSAKWIHNLY